MDLEQLVRQAARGNVDAFIELTRRFQHFAFGSALALIQDFQQAEDVLQEALSPHGRHCRALPVRQLFRLAARDRSGSCGIRRSAWFVAGTWRPSR